MSNREERLAYEAQLKIEKQELFNQDPERYCAENGRGINSYGISSDFRNYYLYRLVPNNNKLIPTYEKYVQDLKFPQGISEFLSSKAQANTVQEINKLVEEANTYITQGTLTQELASVLNSKLEALCK